MSKILRDDLRFQLFSSVRQRLESPKSKRKAFTIIESAISCLAKYGLGHVTLEMIARDAGVTRPLLKHYFKDLQEIETVSLQYIRLVFQNLTIDALTDSKNAEDMLIKYLTASLKWTMANRKHVVVWFSFLHRCGSVKHYRDLNTLAVKTGTERMVALLKQGREEGRFQCSEIERAARQIQLLLTGAIFSTVSEDVGDIREFTSIVVDRCLKIARGEI